MKLYLHKIHYTTCKIVFSCVLGNFIWCFSTRTECHQAKANIQSDDQSSFIDKSLCLGIILCNMFYESFCELEPRSQPEGSYKIGSVCPSLRPSVCLQVFSGLAHQFFLKLGMVLGAHIQLCVTAGFCGKNPDRAKMAKNGQK